jgi:glucose/arabinose dehydrogenase
MMPPMRTTTLVAGVGLGLAAGCGNVAKDKPKDAPAIDAQEIDAPVDAPVLPACATPVSGTKITMRQLSGGVAGGAMLATSPPGDPRLFVIEQRGAIRIYQNETLLAAPFLDLSADAQGPVAAGGELGLLGLAFHPQYAANRTFFIFYTRMQADDMATRYRDVLARCTANATDPNKADPLTCTDVLVIKDFAANHNGGMIEFGKDGFLYIGTGDGGNSNDPFNNGQALNDGTPNAATVALLGKMLRIDVDTKAGGKEYGIPADNPYAAGGGAPEIFMLGLRNPWRWSFDRLTGDMWIADVGQNVFEELNAVPAAQLKGKNFGWSMFEAEACFKTNPPCDTTNKFFPQDIRNHNTGWRAIIGGQVYRGTCYPDIVGTYFYTDNSAVGLIQAVLQPNGTLAVAPVPGTFPRGAASLHEDARGELYLTTTAGTVYHLEAGP